MHNSIPFPDVEIINVEPNKFSPLISKCHIKVCYVGQEVNRNKTVITKEVAQDMAYSLRGTAIVGYYNEDKKDFEKHNKVLEIKDGKYVMSEETRPYGFVDLNAKTWFQWFNDEGTPHEYLVTEGWLWTGQYPEAKRIIEKGNNQSMELDENFTKGNWTKDFNNNIQFFIINETIISKLCILGEDCEPCFEGAQIASTNQFSLDEDFKGKIYSMIEQIQYMLEGGKQMEPEVQETTAEEVEVVVEETPAVEEVEQQEVNEEEKVETAVVEEEPQAEVDEEPAIEETQATTYDLNEIPEYTELLANYNAVCTERDNLNATLANLNETVKSLTEFKANVEKKEKESLINSFYMLSEEDKQEVRDNIDSYTLDEIESKLSVICVRKKVSFELETEKTGDNITTVNVNNAEANSVPGWIKVLDDVVSRDY